MLSFKKSKKTLNIIIEDYVIRIVETNGNDLSNIKFYNETILPKSLIENGRIVDEIGFYEFMKGLVKELGIKNRQVRFNVPNSIVIMRQVETPTSLINKKEILEYLEIEIGKSIHLPFQDPIIDLPEIKDELNDIGTETRQITFFAAPGEELRKYTEVLIDVNLEPISADVGILADYRYVQHTQDINKNHVYLIVEFNVNSVHLGIFSNHKIEFIRYQDLDMNIKRHHFNEMTNELTWEYEQNEDIISGLLEDQVSELERIMNFYRFSIHKGEQQVTNIVLLGDNPHLDNIFQVMNSRYQDIALLQLDDHRVEKSGEYIKGTFIPVLGLAVRGGV